MGTSHHVWWSRMNFIIRMKVVWCITNGWKHMILWGTLSIPTLSLYRTWTLTATYLSYSSINNINLPLYRRYLLLNMLLFLLRMVIVVVKTLWSNIEGPRTPLSSIICWIWLVQLTRCSINLRWQTRLLICNII